MSNFYKKLEDLTLKKHGKHDFELMVNTANTLKKYGVSEEQILNNFGNIRRFYSDVGEGYDGGEWFFKEDAYSTFVKTSNGFGISPKIDIEYCRGEYDGKVLNTDCLITRGLIGAASVREAYSTEGFLGDKVYYTKGIGGTDLESGLGLFIVSGLTKEVMSDSKKSFSFDTDVEKRLSGYVDVLMKYDNGYLVKNFFDTDSDFYEKSENVDLDKSFKGNGNYSVEEAMCRYFAARQHLYSDEKFEQLKNDLSEIPFFDKKNLEILDSAREVNRFKESDDNYFFRIATDDDSMRRNFSVLPSAKNLDSSEFEYIRQLLSEKDEKGLTPFDVAIVNAYENEYNHIKHISEFISTTNADKFTSGNIEFNKQDVLMDVLDYVAKNGTNDYCNQVISAFKDTGLCSKSLMEEIVDRNITDLQFLSHIQKDTLNIETKNGNIINYIAQQENPNFQLVDYFISEGVKSAKINENGENPLYNVLKTKQSIDLKNKEVEELNGFFNKDANKIEIDTFFQKRLIEKLMNDGISLNAVNPVNGLKPIDLVVGVNLDEKITPDRDMLQFLLDNHASIDSCLNKVMENKDIDTLKLFIDNGIRLEDMLKKDIEASSNLSFKEMDKLERYEKHRDKEIEKASFDYEPLGF